MPFTPHYTPGAITILATYRCTAMCTNCCFDSNPWLKERLTLEEILQFIEAASQFSTLELVGFSGGECFLLGDDLVQAVSCAHQLGLKTRCVTNGYWAKSIESGRKRLQALKDAGLNELNISTGDFHQEYVAQDTVINAAQLGVELNLDETLIVVEMQKARVVTGDGLLANPRMQQIASSGRFKLIESPWMPMDFESTIPQNANALLNRANVGQRGGCRSVLSTMVLTPHRKLGFCCGLSREHIPELNARYNGTPLTELVQEHATDFVKIWLFVDGPERILAWAASKDPEIEWENRYGHQCHSCAAIFRDERVRQVISDHYEERVSDVLMRYDMLIRRQQVMDVEMHS